ncbi:MAG: hypothetical protein K0S07_1233 [Chlamydiales bacterium]|jgi:mannose-6-phosphate isomerase-like protein (cupin superfamily)|nr:hypothetical protein [Chlamydiales bacterium]
MEYIAKHQSQHFTPHPSCSIQQFPTEDAEIDMALATISERYPEKGFALNRIAKMIVYVLKGEGSVVFKEREIALSAGDVVLIAPGEAYFWRGALELLIAATPKWSPEQSEIH